MKNWLRDHAMWIASGGLVVAMLASLGIGDMPLSLDRIWAGLWKEDEMASIVLWQIRVPRMLVAIEIGAALAASGVVMQAYFRNSLASPGLLGVSSGGVAGAVIAIGAGWAVIVLYSAYHGDCRCV